MASYKVLNAMSAESFLNPELFVTEYDNLSSHIEQGTKEKQYRTGLKVSREAKCVFISAYGTWGADLGNGTSLSAPEGIGYHACTADLLKGFLDGPAPVKVYRMTDKGITCTTIKE